MTFWAADKNKKPDRWGLDSGFAGPEWDWFWDAQVILPLWEGAGTIVRNLSKKYTGVLSIVGSPWVASPVGIGFDIQDAGDILNFNPFYPMNLTNELSMFFYQNITSYGGATAGWWRSGSISNKNQFFLASGNDGLWLRINGFDIYKGTSGVDDFIGLATASFSFRESDEASGYFNGVLLHDVTHAIDFAETDASHELHNIGYQFDTANRINGQYLMVVIWDKYLSHRQHLQLARDPFGPFRMDSQDELQLPGSDILEVAAGGGLQPWLRRRRR